MPAVWKTVRVFISSTFRDMHAERDHLVKVVFPALRERLQKHRIHLVDIDLRWGVTREQAENDQVLDLCLQQIDECRPFFIGILGERYGWVPTRYPADAIKKFGWIQHHSGKSVTELEVLHGVLRNPQMRSRAFFYFRNPDAVEGVPEAIRRDVYSEIDTSRIRKLKDLIRHSGYPVMENYPARWDPEAYDRPSRSKGRLVDLNDFGQRVHNQLWLGIQEEFQLPEQPPVEPTASASPALAEEEDYHKRFMESRLRVYVGRKNVRNDLARYADGDDPFPCLLTGASGSGKSAALARFVRVYERARRNTLVIPHFIGASPRSTNLRDMLRRFCQVLKARFGFAEDVPEEAAKLSVTFREFVGKVPADTRILLVIDALNQLDEADRAQELYWLPTELPPQVKVMVSCITDSGKTEPVLDAFRGRKHSPMQLAALSGAEQREIIRQVPSLSAKTLDDDQVRLLLTNPATANPLFLLVALEELRGFAPYERLNERIVAFPREGDTVTAIFSQVIERLAEEFNQKLVETVLTLLASARRGLSERELQELVAGLDGADDLFPVLRQLRPYLLSRAGLIDFYHRNLFKAVCERYLPSEEQQRQAHGRLAEYFNAQDYWLESLEEQQRRAKALPPTPRPANVRKVDELPWQLLQAADWPKSEELLTDLAFLEAKAEAGMVFDLAADFSAAIRPMPADRPLLRILRLLEESLRRDIHFIARHQQDYPQGLFQSLWNTCWWHDASEAAAHYDLSNRTSNGPLPWELPADQRLMSLLERWRAERERRTPGSTWLRSLRPSAMHLGTAQKAVLRGHEKRVESVALSDDGRRIVSGSWDKTVRVWDAATGQELLCLRGHTGEVNSVAVSGDGQRTVSGSLDKTVRVWDAGSGQELLCLRGHEESVTKVALSGDGRRIVSGSNDGTVRVWNVTNGLELVCLRGHASEVTGVGVSDDGRNIVSSAMWDNTVRMWNATSGNEILSLHGHERFVRNVAMSGDARRILTASDDKTVRVWDGTGGQELLCLSGHEKTVSSVAVSGDGQRIVSGSWDKTVRVWNATNGQEILCLRGHESGVIHVAVSSDGRCIVSASDDETVRVWDATSGHEFLSLRGHTDVVRSVEVSGNGQRFVSGSGRMLGTDNSVRVWDATSGKELLCLLGHERSVVNVAMSGDGRRIVSASDDKTVRVWDGTDGQEFLCLRGYQSVALSGDGRRIVSGSNDGTVRVWDATNGLELVCLRGHASEVTGVEVSDDGRNIVSGSRDKTVRVWDAATGQELLCLRGHEHWVISVAMSGDGRRIVSGSQDETARVWDAASGQELLCLRGHAGCVNSVAVSGDSRRIVSGSLDNTVRVWDSASGQCLQIYRGLPDIKALAQGASRFPFIALAQPLETAVQESDSQRPIAWLPGSVSRITTHPSGGTWAGAVGSYVCVFTLEHNLPRTN